MRKVLICQIDPQTASELKRDMEGFGWAIDSCGGMLEMLRLIEENEYEMVVLNANHRNVEICTRLEAIKALEKNPKILLNLPDSVETLPSLLLMADYPMIKGNLTTEKLLAAAQEET
jgi:DNA-binding response OmpR family regulator